MPLAPGTRLGSFEILGPIGAGGMGEVYKAVDTKLHREVAIKVLPASLANDSDYLARFQREAQALAALHHPNIASIFGLEQNAIIMELVEGKPLKGPLPMTEVLPIARQIAEALEAAHEKGIIHRDLKPGNILVTADGTVKVLDFGLAKAVERPAETNANSPTLTMRATEAGLILGTASYMSPEQAAGKPVDRRADIWSFGVVLHELITGRRLFHGETVSHTLADVLKGDIDTSDIPPGPIRDLVNRCLDRNLKTRLQHIGEARIAIENSPDAVQPAPPPSRNLHWALIATAVVTTAVAAWALLSTPPPAPRQVIRQSIALPVYDSEVSSCGVNFSRDGQFITYVQFDANTAQTQLMLRRIDEFEARVIPGTAAAGRPAFSADTQWIFFTGGGRMSKVAITGGPPISIAQKNIGHGFAFPPDDTIIFGGNGLTRMRLDGSNREPITKLEPGETTHRFPQILPGGETLLFNIVKGLDSNNAPIAALNLKSGTRRTLNVKGGTPRYIPTGHLLYVRDSILFAVPFDVQSLVATGPEFPAVSGVFHNRSGGFADYSVSENGHLAYFSENRIVDGNMVLASMDGTTTQVPGGAGRYAKPSLSPDGKRIAVAINAPNLRGDIWVLELDRGIKTRLTTEGTFSNPIWSPDGLRVTYLSDSGDVFSSSADGSGKPRIIIPSLGDHRFQIPESWMPDGQTLLFTQSIAIAAGPLMSVTGTAKPARIPELPASQIGARISPDGKALAYISSESGAEELYVKPYPAGPRIQVSTSGADAVVWSPDSRRLFYKASERNSPLLSASIQLTGAQIRAGKPEKIFDFDGALCGVTPDGKRFLMLQAASPDARAPKLNLVLNWFDELRRLSPVTGAAPPPKPN